jgi:ribosomal protein S18 acetylase RimI-like enzyme
MLPYQIVEQNLRETMRFFALAKPTGELREMPGVTIVCSGVDYAVFNAAMLSAPVSGSDSGLARRITAASVHFAARGLRWSYWVCEDLLDRQTRNRSHTIFLHHGLRPLVEPPGMLAEQLLPPKRPLADLEYRRVVNEGTRLAFCDITSIAFDLPFSVSREIYDSERVWNHGMVGWVGYRHGVPVTTAATVKTEQAIGVYSVATLPQHQRQGFGEAIVRHAVQSAREEGGVERTILQSTRPGLRLYERMGYKTVTRFTVYLAS